MPIRFVSKVCDRLMLCSVCSLLLCLSSLFAAKAWSKGVLTYGNIQHLNDPQLDGAGSQWVDFSYYNRKESGRFLMVADADLRLYPDANESAPMLSAKELYVDYYMGSSNMSFGRRILEWDPTEKYWNMGMLNAQRGYNPLEQDQEGIMALRLSRRFDGFSGEIFGSFVHIPQLNPGMSVKDGKVVSPNPWAKLPPSSDTYQGIEVPIYYELEMPAYTDLLLQPSVGGRLKIELGRRSWMSTYYAWKPENSLRTNATGYYEQESEERAFVRAKPFVNHHQIIGASFATNITENWAVHAGYINVKPEKKGDEGFRFESLKIQPNYFDEAYARLAVAWHNDYSTVSLNAIERLQGEVKEDDILGTKPRWKRAVGMFIDHAFNDAFGTRIDWKHDIVLKDILLKQDIWWNIDKHVRLSVGAELLQAPSSNSYWSYIRSNDTFYSSASYSF